MSPPGLTCRVLSHGDEGPRGYRLEGTVGTCRGHARGTMCSASSAVPSLQDTGTVIGASVASQSRREADTLLGSCLMDGVYFFTAVTVFVGVFF